MVKLKYKVNREMKYSILLVRMARLYHVKHVYRPQLHLFCLQGNMFRMRVSRILLIRAEVPGQVFPSGPFTPPRSGTPLWNHIHPPYNVLPFLWTRYTSPGPCTETPGTRYIPPVLFVKTHESFACRKIRETSGRYASYWIYIHMHLSCSGGMNIE